MGPTPPDRVTPVPADGDSAGAWVFDVGAAGPDDGWLVAVGGALALAPEDVAGAADDGADPTPPAPEDPDC